MKTVHKDRGLDFVGWYTLLPITGPTPRNLAIHQQFLEKYNESALLLGFQSTAAHNMPFVTKVMLTCFRSNARALAFYRKHGFEADDISPGPRILRGKMYQPDYAILSKPSKPTE